jgi:hypothetical protein
MSADLVAGSRTGAYYSHLPGEDGRTLCGDQAAPLKTKKGEPTYLRCSACYSRSGGRSRLSPFERSGS